MGRGGWLGGGEACFRHVDCVWFLFGPGWAGPLASPIALSTASLPGGGDMIGQIQAAWGLGCEPRTRVRVLTLLLTCQSLQPLFAAAPSVSGLCRALGTQGSSTWSLVSGSSQLEDGASACERLRVVRQGGRRVGSGSGESGRAPWRRCDLYQALKDGSTWIGQGGWRLRGGKGHSRLGCG